MIFPIHCSCWAEQVSKTRLSVLNLVDLAGLSVFFNIFPFKKTLFLSGSENAKMTNSRGERAREAKHINQSLLTLSTIIQRLSERDSNKNSNHHLPYRDSKLTRVLQPSLSGNAYIAFICTISAGVKCYEE